MKRFAIALTAAECRAAAAVLRYGLRHGYHSGKGPIAPMDAADASRVANLLTRAAIASEARAILPEPVAAVVAIKPQPWHPPAGRCDAKFASGAACNLAARFTVRGLDGKLHPRCAYHSSASNREDSSNE